MAGEKSEKKTRWEAARKYLYPLAAALLVTALVGSGLLQRVDRWAQDLLYQRPGAAGRDIVIIGIDDKALDMLGPYNTWDRNIIASVLEVLASDPDNKPAVTCVDVLYAGRSSQQADQRLAAAAENLGNVVTATLAEFGLGVTWENGHATSMDASAVINYEEPYEELAACTVQGHINAMTDSDDVMRHALLYVEPESGRVYSMAYQAAKLFLEQKGKTPRMPAANSRGMFYIPYTARPGTYSDDISVVDLLMGNVPSGYWAGRIVLIGVYTGGLLDAYFTPIQRGKQMFGVEIQANVIQSLLDGNFKREIGDWPQLIVIFILSLAAVILFLRLRLAPGGAVCAGLAALGAGLPLLMYRLGWVVHPLWLPICALALYILALADHYVRAARERMALALENERIGAELSVATRIQTDSLPREFPPFPERTEFDIYASMDPAKEVGGDLYDFFLIDEDHLGLVIGDVSGKGVPAALLMMVAAALIRNALMTGDGPAKALQSVNAQICARNPDNMFVTVWLGVLEISTGKVTAANAGHEFPALKKASEHFELFKDKHGFVVGGMDGVRYREYQLALEPGDKLFVYTDGVAEATDSKEELFGTDRMIEALRSGEDGTPQAVLEAVNRAVAAFVGEAPQFDDLTMLCLQYNGAPAAKAETEGPAEAQAQENI